MVLGHTGRQGCRAALSGMGGKGVGRGDDCHAVTTGYTSAVSLCLPLGAEGWADFLQRARKRLEGIAPLPEPEE